jgi:hypothetical protein
MSRDRVVAGGAHAPARADMTHTSPHAASLLTLPAIVAADLVSGRAGLDADEIELHSHPVVMARWRGRRGGET